MWSEEIMVQACRRTLLTLMVGANLFGCADQLRPLRQDISKVQTGLNDLRNIQADQTTRLATLETELRNLSGRLEEFEYAQNRRAGTVDTLQQNVDTLARRVPPPPIVPVAALEADENLVAKLPREVGEPFEAALQKIRTGTFSDAESRLREASDLTQGTDWWPNVNFWLGVTYEGLGDNRQAVRIYHELVSAAPKHQRAALALLREASVLIRLGDSKTAKLSLNKLIAEFPRSEEALRARERLRDL